MDLNNISCGGYNVGKNTVLFSLYDTTMKSIADLDGQKLTLTISDSDIMIFDGYEIVSIEKNSDAIRVRISKKLNEATAKSIGALEENYQTLHSLVNSNQASTSTDISNVMTALSTMIMRADLTDEEAFVSKPFFPQWEIGYDYKKDWIISYNGELYRIGQDHTSQEQWTPGSLGTTALYSKISISEEGYETWKEYDGVSGAYSKNQIVIDPTDSQLYKSKIDNNVWGPPSKQLDYWERYSENK